MTMDPQIRTLTRTRSRSRRLSACHRHPNEPINGFCPLCLRDRLAGLEDSNAGELENVVGFSTSSRRTRGHGCASSSALPAEMRRSKSVAVARCEGLNGFALDARRKSCDVRARNSLSDLFTIDDTKSGGEGVVRVESKNLGFSTIAEPVMETKEEEEEDDDIDKIRVCDDVFVRNEVDYGGEVEDDEDLKTMKEHIDMELQNKRKNFWETASVFSQKLRKWRQKQKEKKQRSFINGETDRNSSKLGQFKDTQSEVADYGFGRRSCDTEPRFSVDANRISVEDPRFSLDEHRASWDGYMIARTIPRLRPMLSIVDDMMLAPVNRGAAMDNLQMQSINEDGASSSGLVQSISDSSSSNRGSSSSSMKSSSTKTACLEGDDKNAVSNARLSPPNDVNFQRTKLIITERELKDWHLNSIQKSNLESVSNAPISANTAVDKSKGHRKAMASRWKKVCNLWGYKEKLGDKTIQDETPEILASAARNSEINGVERGHSSAKLLRNNSCVSSRNRTETHQSGKEGCTRHSVSDIDSGLLKLYLAPFRSSRRSKYGKGWGRNSKSSSMAASALQLN